MSSGEVFNPTIHWEDWRAEPLTWDGQDIKRPVGQLETINANEDGMASVDMTIHSGSCLYGMHSLIQNTLVITDFKKNGSSYAKISLRNTWDVSNG